MRFLLLIIISLHICLFGYSGDNILEDYKNKDYKKVCLESASFYKNGGKNEKLLSIIGDACSKVDYINPLGYMVRGLISTPEFRENGSYFATLVLQKKLIYQFMNDRIDLKNLRLPRSGHVLSIVFENLVKNNYKEKNNVITIVTGKREFKVWIDNKKKRVVHIDEYKNGNKIKMHGYL